MSDDEIQIRQRGKESNDSEEEERPVTRKRKRNGENEDGPSHSTEKQNVANAIKPKKKKKKSENLTGSRLVSYLMISPTLIYFISVMYDVIAKYSIAGKAFHVAAAVVGAAIAAGFCLYFYKTLQAYLKYLAVASLLVFLIPTVQVFNCSPLHLDNSRIGTNFKLKESLDDIIKISYHNQECWKNQYFKTPYSMSLYTPRLKISIKPYQIINLNMYHYAEREESDDGPPPDTLPNPLYLFASQRSVKRQMYNLNLIAMASGKMRTLADVLDLSMDHRENVTLDVTGTLLPLGPKFNETTHELQEMEFLYRPLVFQVQVVEVFGAPAEETENPTEYEADKSKWRKKEKPTGRGGK